MRFVVLSVLALPLLACVNGPKNDDPAPKKEEPAPEPCVYPEAGPLTGVGDVMPNVRWAEAIQPDGSLLDFSLEDFHCNPVWDAYTSVTFIAVAEWCPNCPAYLQYIRGGAAQLEDAGSYLVILDLETREYDLPTNESAQTYVTSKIGESVGLRVGDGDAEPRGLLYGSTIWSAVPGGWVVRRSDMRVVANQDDWQTMLNYTSIAEHLDADWSDPNNPPFFSTCAEGDEEASEPNDTPAEAALLAVGTVSGGICAAEPDYYTVSVAGAWRADLELDPALGDLDIYVMDPATNEPLVVDGQPIGSFTYDAIESFTHTGEATVMVIGFNGSSSPYTLTLTEQ